MSDITVGSQIPIVFAGKFTHLPLRQNETSEVFNNRTHARSSFTLENIESWGVILGVHIPAQRCSAERMPPKPLCACNSTPDSFLFKQDETGGRQQRLAWDQKAVKHSCFVDSDGPHPTCKTHGGAEWSAVPMPPSPRGRGVRWEKKKRE